MTYFISAYAASPSSQLWQPQLESDYFHALAACPDIIGIEHPFEINVDKYPLSWLRSHIPDHWSMIITALPSSMTTMLKNPYFGLASQNKDARKQAALLMEEISQYIQNINDIFGRKLIKAVHFHSLPKNSDQAIYGCIDSLKYSLDDMSHFGWDGAELNLEHCDAYIAGQKPDKGFLLLSDEIEAIQQTGDFGLVLNWARSVIEGRSILEVIKHISMAKEAHLLRGFFFSGCTDQMNHPYGIWKDTHMPPNNKLLDGRYLENASLLGLQEMKAVFELLDKSVYLGVKVSDANLGKSLEKSIGLNLETIKMLNVVKHAIRAS